MKDVSCPTCLSTLLLKDEELARLLMYDEQKLLLNVVTLVSPLRLTLVSNADTISK